LRVGGTSDEGKDGDQEGGALGVLLEATRHNDSRTCLNAGAGWSETGQQTNGPSLTIVQPRGDLRGFCAACAVAVPIGEMGWADDAKTAIGSELGSAN